MSDLVKLRRDQEIVYLYDVPLEDIKPVMAALLDKLGMKVIRASGVDYVEYEIFNADDIDHD